MKTKNVFLSMGLAFLMGLAGCQSTGPLMAKAAVAETLYLDFGTCESYWGDAVGASGKVYGYFFEGVSQSWPGTEMTPITAKKLYSVSYASGASKVIFNLGSGKGNSYQTVDLTIPNDGKNLFTISHENGGKQDGSWSTYGEPEPDPDFYLYGSMTSWAENEAYKMVKTEETPAGYASQYFLDDVVLAEDGLFKIKYGGTYFGFDKLEANANFEGDDDGYGGENIKVLTAGTYDVYIKVHATLANSRIYIGPGTPEPEPEPESWHLKGTMTSWAAEEEYALAAKDESLPEGVDHQFYISKALAKDDEFKFNLGESETWLGYDALEDVAARAGFHKGTEEGHVGNIIVDVAGTYSFYLKQLHAGGYSIFFSVEQNPASETKNEFYVWDQNGVLGNTFADLKVYGFGQAFNVEAFEEFPGSHSGITAKNDVEGINHLYQVELSVSYPKFVFNNGTKQTIDVEEIHAGQVFYISNSTDGEGKYQGGWISLEDLTVADGTYLRGDWANGWSVQGQVTMNVNPGDASEQMVGNLQLSAGSKLKVITYTNHVPTWHGASEVWVSGEKQDSALDEYGNALVPSDGKYTLYVNTTTWKYAFDVQADVDLAKASAYVDSFHAALRAEGVCDTVNGTSTNVANLATAWTSLKALYNGETLTDGARTLLASGTANAKLVEFAELYDMIIVKYSAQLGESPDFLNRNPVASNVVMMPVDNTYIVVLSIAATVTLVGLTAVILRKKKLAK